MRKTAIYGIRLLLILAFAAIAQAQAPKGITLTSVDDRGGYPMVGYYTSIAIGSDGLPVISYYDTNNFDLMVAKCGNEACSAGNTITAVDTNNSVDPSYIVGKFTSITIGTDGLPVISYTANILVPASQPLKVAKCGNAACSAGNTITAVNGTHAGAQSTSIAIGADGLPIISYWDAGDLKVAKCVNAECTGTNTIITSVDTVGNVGADSSIAIGADGLPVISYTDTTNNRIKVAKCVNADCTGTSTITIVDTVSLVGGAGAGKTSIKIGADGLPVISYNDHLASQLKVAKCGNAACALGNTITFVNPAGASGGHSSIALGADGLPIISYWDGALKVAKCVNADCTGMSTIIPVDTVDTVGTFTSITIGTDGLPVISYNDSTNSSLKVAKFLAAKVRYDFNGDSRSEIVWRNMATGQDYLYPMNSTTILPAEGYFRTVADLNWKVVGIGDFDGDGHTDILWRNSTTGQNYIYLMNGKTILPSEGYIRAVPDQNWRVAGIGDFDGDGKSDILWRNTSTGQNYLYLMDGLVILGTEGFLRSVADLDWQIAGMGDFDGDGRSDILWRNSATGENYLYFMNGTSILGTEGYIRTVADKNWKVAGVGDFNGDGKEDILWRNSTTGENYLYPMNGTAINASEGYLRTVADQNWEVAAIGDFDGDGKADILWRNSTTGENYLYPMNGTTIYSSEGYLRTVADQNWQVQNPR